MKKILVLGSLVLLAAAGCNKQTDNNNNDNQPVATTQNMVTFSNYYQTGFEGVDTKFDYSIKYPADSFKVEKSSQGFNIIENANNQTHKVLFGFNGGIGAQTSSEFWNAVNYCGDCTLTSNNIQIAGANDLKTYSNGTDEWIIYKVGDDFVLVDMKKPIEAVDDVVKTLEVQTSVIRK
jgi:hypothetical protein